MKTLLISSFLLWVGFVPIQAQDWMDDADFRTHYETLRALDPDQVLQAMPKARVSDNARNLLTGWAYYQKGNYGQAESFLNKVNREDKSMGKFIAYRAEELLKSTEVLKSFKVVDTPHFSIRVQPGRDEVLLFYLEDVLESAYEAYARFFQFQPSEKILVEIMPDHVVFSYASALTKSQIETTGTVALCVENRLAVISPRRVLMGYYWPDVLSHELVHYFLTKISRDHAPLWFQEGVAKYLEARWENPNAAAMDKHLENALAQGIAADRWITLEQMHPSFAALPTAELAQQAYAQVASMVDFLTRRKGPEIIRQIGQGLATEKEINVHLKRIMGLDYAAIEAEWKEWARNQNYQMFDTMAAHGVTLLDNDAKADELNTPELKNEEQKKHLNLGDLLLERQRYKAALIQYDKLVQDQAVWPRQIQLRVLRCLEQMDDPDRLLEVVQKQATDLENDPTMLKYKAKALAKLNRLPEADATLVRAIRLNPFDPNIQIQRREIAERLGRKEDILKINKVLELLSTAPAPPEKDSKS